MRARSASPTTSRNSPAGWITAGDPGVDIGPYRAWRFSDTYRDPGFAAGLARETYSDYYRLRYPFDADLAGRPRRLSALHGRLQETGAVFGTKAGWERADHHDPPSRHMKVITHRSFSVVRLKRAKTTATMRNRVMIFGSSHPSCSKW